MMQTMSNRAPSRPLRGVTAIALLVAAALSAACAGQTAGPVDDERTPIDLAPREVGDAPGVYVLRRVAGEPVPAKRYEVPGSSVRTLADTIYLHADGWGALHATLEYGPEDGEPRVRREANAFEYSVSDGRFSAEFPCNDVITLPAPSMAACAAPPHLVGRLVDGGLTLELAMSHRAPLEYERVSGPSPVASVSISPSGGQVVLRGESKQLRATARDAQGNTVAGRNAAWIAISGGTLSVAQNGVVRGVERGGGYVIAIVDGRADTVTVVVR